MKDISVGNVKLSAGNVKLFVEKK